MTPAQAQAVYRWREIEDMSWRALAAKWVETFGEDELDGEFRPEWSGTQLAGMELCERARAIGRRSIGVELSPSYAALCARRLQQLSLFAGADA
jgi:alkylation response protein AidB-like acyl-CoA dehydrogenase